MRVGTLSNNLTQMVNFHTQIPGCDSHSPALLDLFISSDGSICSAMAFPPLGNSDHVAVSVSIDFPSNSQQDAPFHRIAYDFSCADWEAAIVHRNHFLRLYQKDKSSKSKVKFRQASNHCKRVLEAAKLIQQESNTSQKIGSRDFW